MNVGVEADVQFLGHCCQGDESAPGAYSIWSTRAKTDIPLAHPLSHRQFSRVVVQGQFWKLQDRKQCGFLGHRLGNELVQFIISGTGGLRQLRRFQVSQGFVVHPYFVIRLNNR